MRLIQSDAIELSPWADEHDPLTSEARGPLPAFDQPAPRANRIPRPPAVRNVPVLGVCRRLHRTLKVRYLTWQLASMRGRMDRLEADMGAALQLAIDMAKRHQHSPALQARRRLLRADHTALATEWLRVRQEIDNLQVPR